MKIYIWGVKKTSFHTKRECLYSCKLSQAKTTKRHSCQSSTNSPYPPTQALPKVQLYIVAECRSIYRAKNNDRRKNHAHTHTHAHTHIHTNTHTPARTHARTHARKVIMIMSASLNTHISASAHHSTHNRIDCHAYIDKEMGFQRRSERLNGVFLLDALGEDISGGGNHIPEGWSL